MSVPLRVYFAGALFDHKDLTGNLQLARATEAASKDKYRFFLPQLISHQTTEPQAIRDLDFAELLSSDLAVFNFDGAELDSGTVVEFMAAKMADLPAVQLRTDFRAAGDQGPNGDPWNLMCSFYPRTERLWAQASCWMGTKALESVYHDLGSQLAQALDRALCLPSRFGGQLERALLVYEELVASLGGQLPEKLDRASLESLLRGKLERRLL